VLALVIESYFVVYDLPAAVATCIGVPIPSGMAQAKEIVDAVKAIVNMLVINNGLNLLDLGTFLAAVKKEVPAVSDRISESDQDTIQKLVARGDSCGSEIYSIVDCRSHLRAQDKRHQ
jgi:hypothetical protein